MQKFIELFRRMSEDLNRPFANRILITSGVRRTLVMYSRYRENGHIQMCVADIESGTSLICRAALQCT